ncbi:hypothetical protein AAHA92_03672 [Salvia divinorum]|uniref:Uncharacterized protein n=1 Tax=Salvia divinorum TaxID=28513 RepID=A0ABD1III5_SALDI
MGQERCQRCIISRTSDIDSCYFHARCIFKCPISGHSFWSSSPLACILARGITQDAGSCHVSEDFYKYKYIMLCIQDKDEMVAIEGFRSLERVVGISITELDAAIDVMRRILRVSHRPVLRFSAFRALDKVGMVHEVVRAAPEDHIAIGLDVNVYKLYMEQDNEPEAELVSQVIKSQSFADKEASTRDWKSSKHSI